jgi:hypothetical protein
MDEHAEFGVEEPIHLFVGQLSDAHACLGNTHSRFRRSRRGRSRFGSGDFRPTQMNGPTELNYRQQRGDKLKNPGPLPSHIGAHDFNFLVVLGLWHNLRVILG